MQLELISTSEYEVEEHREYFLASLPANDKLPSPDPRPEFVSDLRDRGQLHPITVCRLTDGELFVAAGRRRIKALRQLERGLIWVNLFLDVPRMVAVTMMSASNQQRSENPLSDYEAIVYLHKQGIVDEKACAGLLGMSIQTYRKWVKLAKLPEPILKKAQAGVIATGPLQDLAALAPAYHRRALAEMDALPKEKKYTGKHVAALRNVQTQAATPMIDFGDTPAVPAPVSTVRYAVLNGNSTAYIYDNRDAAAAAANGEQVYMLVKA